MKLKSPQPEELKQNKTLSSSKAVVLLAASSRGRVDQSTSVGELLTLLLSAPLSMRMIQTGGNWQVPLAKTWVLSGVEVSEITVTLNCQAKKNSPGKARAVRKLA